MNENSTIEEYKVFYALYDFLNKAFFCDELPGALITLTARGKSAGLFRFQAFTSAKDEESRMDEIALNPVCHFDRPLEWASTFVHELCHQWQLHNGNPTRAGYHNKQFARKLEACGVMPSTTGEPGGSKVGQQMCDYVIPGGIFEKKMKRFKSKPNWHGLRQLSAVDTAAAKKRKITYSCPSCEATAWGKPGLNLVCGDCDETMNTGDRHRHE
ncbi:MAG: SprT family zinc-dependent metalloprotease [bacterium]|nr:SprT family zinc-dependent metalloprotease [bacterium]